MEQITLDTAFITEGLAHIAFWNGRVLTAEDLRDEQLANHLARRQLGRALGSGVAHGMRVSTSATLGQINVSAGLAIDTLGQVVELPVDVTVSLVVPPETAHGDDLFTVCQPLASNSPTGTGVYLLVVRPATRSQSSVAGVSAFGNGVATECGPKYTVDGISFRLVRVDASVLAADLGHDAADVAVLDTVGSASVSDTARNILAHLFLDTRANAVRSLDPFGGDPTVLERGAMAELRSGPLLPCEVPIALLTWSFDGVGFVDNWSVRRPPSVEPALTAVQTLGSRQRVEGGRVSYAQFQEQVSAILTDLTATERAGFVIADRFRYLPAAGLIPMARTGRAGFAAGVFGDVVVRGPIPIDAALVGALLDDSFRHQAIDLASGEVVHLYAVVEPVSGTVDHLVFSTSRIDLINDELVIDAVFPGGALHIGQRIEIRGRQFGFTTGDARVFFDDRRANPLPGSSDTRLVVDVPTSLLVDEEGSEVMLQVTSNAGSDSVPVVIGHPDQPAVGALHVSWQSVDPSTLVRGRPGRIIYTVRSAVTPAVDVELVLDGTAVAVDAARLLDVAGAPITGPVRMSTDDEITVIVEIDPIPALDEFTISFGARADDIADNDTRRFQTDVPTSPADPTITLLTNDFSVRPGPTAELDGSTIRMEHGAQANIEIIAEFTQAAGYLVTVDPTSLVGPWKTVLSEPLNGRIAPIPVAEFDGDGIAVRNIIVTVARDSAPEPAPSSVTLMVRRDGQTRDARVTFALEAL